MTFIPFESTEAMFEWMQTRTSEANSQLAPDQQQVTYGDCWARFDQLNDIGVLFGRVLTLDEVRTTLQIQGMGDLAIRSEVREISEAHDNGYLYGRVYSPFRPQGEWGDTHRLNVWPIESELMQAAREIDWRYQEMALHHRLNLSIAHQQWVQHMRELS